MFGTNAAASSRRSNGNPPVLRAKVEDVRSLASLIRPIAHAAHATIWVEEAGLTFITEYDRCVHAKAWVHAPLFSTFDVNLKPARSANQDPETNFTLDSVDDGNFTGLTSVDDGPDSSSSEDRVQFEINLHSFLEAIDIFGGASTIKANSAGTSFSSSTSTAAGAGGGTHGQNRGHQQYRRTDRFDGAAGGKGTEGWKRRFGTGFGDKDGSTEHQDGAGGGGGRDWSHSGPTSMLMKYAGHGSPLILIMEENDVSTQCSLATFEPSLNSDYAFDRDSCVAQVIMKSEWLQEAIEVIDSSASKVTLHFLPTDRGGPAIGGPRPRRMRTKDSLKLTADADFGAVEIDLPRENSMMDMFECKKATVNSYRFSHLHQAIKALQVSLKVSMRTDKRGMLSMQFLMPRGTGTGADPTMKKSLLPAGASMRGDGHGFIELVCVPLDEEVAEEDGSDDDGFDYTGIGGGAYSMHF
ncbi:hypothetical protein CF319_g3143 [Tilletia indica]|nr:hypothetical protein CF319_g3143 [Tilletia indica]